jgi:predicted methyltransferase
MMAMSRPSCFVLVMIVLLSFSSVHAGEQSVRPGVNRQYENPNWQQWVNTFERSGREVYDKRHAIVAASAVQPGMSVADIGAGTGLFTRLFAEAVTPTGTVYAVDISESFIENILRSSREQGLANVQGIINTPRDAGLPADSIDLAFITDTYHHFEYPASMLASIHSALHRDGRLIIIDFRRDPRVSSRWVMGHVRGNKALVIGEVQAAGFRLVDDKPLLQTNYFLLFEKALQ